MLRREAYHVLDELVGHRVAEKVIYFILPQLYSKMNSCDYYVTDSVFITYEGGGEETALYRIDRSRIPRTLGKRRKGQSIETWIEENMDLHVRIVFENDVWNVQPWEVALYELELRELALDIKHVVRITRETSYRLA